MVSSPHDRWHPPHQAVSCCDVRHWRAGLGGTDCGFVFVRRRFGRPNFPCDEGAQKASAGQFVLDLGGAVKRTSHSRADFISLLGCFWGASSREYLSRARSGSPKSERGPNQKLAGFWRTSVLWGPFAAPPQITGVERQIVPVALKFVRSLAF